MLKKLSIKLSWLFYSLPQGTLSQTVCCRLQCIGVSTKVDPAEGLNI